MSELQNDLLPIATLETSLSQVLQKTKELTPINPIPKEKVGSSVLTHPEKKLVLSVSNFPKVTQYPALALKYKVMIAINKTIMFVGFKVMDLEFVYEDTFNYIRRNYPNLTMEEIEIAFNKGSMNDYGEWHGLSARTFCMWIKSYTIQTKITALKLRESVLKEKPKKKTTKELQEEDDKWLKNILTAYDNYKKGRTKEPEFYDFGNHFYTRLVKLGILKTTKKLKEQIYKQATKVIIDKEKVKKMSNNTYKLSDALEKLNNPKNKDSVSRITFEARKIALKVFLKNCKNKKVDLRKLIENKTKASKEKSQQIN